MTTWIFENGDSDVDAMYIHPENPNVGVQVLAANVYGMAADEYNVSVYVEATGLMYDTTPISNLDNAKAAAIELAVEHNLL